MTESSPEEILAQETEINKNNDNVSAFALVTLKNIQMLSRKENSAEDKTKIEESKEE